MQERLKCQEVPRRAGGGSDETVDRDGDAHYLDPSTPNCAVRLQQARPHVPGGVKVSDPYLRASPFLMEGRGTSIPAGAPAPLQGQARSPGPPCPGRSRMSSTGTLLPAGTVVAGRYRIEEPLAGEGS